MSSLTTLLDVVSESFKRYKNSPAVQFDDGRQPPVVSTYRQVQQLSSQIYDILNDYSVNQEIVGVCIPPSPHLPAVLIGILKAGAAFYNFEASGEEFVSLVVKSMGIRFVLVNFENFQIFENFFLLNNSRIINSSVLETIGVYLIQLENIQLRKHVQGLAYCITTSGTTGTPKIVRVAHSCILPNIIHLRKIFNMHYNDQVFLSSPLTFDPSLVDLFLSFASGACLLIIPHVIKMMPRALLNMLAYRHKVTVLQATPTLLSRIDSSTLSTTLLGETTSLRILALGGEKFPAFSVLHQWRSPANKTRIFNLYGTTEVSCWATCYEVVPHDIGKQNIPLGAPLEDTVVSVLDVNGQEVTEGEGQLYIGGKESRMCYVGNENPTCIKTPPLRPTGDWVHIQKSGCIVYLSRLDDQVKRNGRRINLCEIEQIMNKLQEVENCKVLYEDRKLCVFVVLCRTSSLTPQTVDSWIHRHLPTHYWPDVVQFVENIPVTKHGKCDKKALMNQISRTGGSLDKPDRNITDIVQSIWNEVLDLPVANTDPKSTFLLCGGDSLKAVTFVDIVESRFNLILQNLLDIVLHKRFSDVVNYIIEKIKESDKVNVEKSSNNVKDVSVIDNLKIDSESGDGIQPSVSSINWKKVQNTKRKRPHSPESGCLESPSSYCYSNQSFIDKNITNYTQANKILKTTKLINDTGVQSEAGEEGVSVGGPSKEGEIILALGRGNRTHKCNVSLYHKTTDKLSYAEFSGCFDNRESKQENFLKLHHNLEDLKKDCVESETKQFMGISALNYSANVKNEISLQGDGVEEIRIKEDMSTPDGNEKEATNICVDLKWKFDTRKCVDGSPLIVETRSGYHIVFIGSHSHRFAAIVMETGRLLWEAVLGDRIESSACVSHCGKYIIIGSYDGVVYVLCALGGSIWWEFQTEGEVKSSAAVDPLTSLVLVGSHDKHLYALDVQRRVCVFKTHMGGGSVFSSPSVSRHPHAVYVSTLAGHVTAVQPATGDILWQYHCGKPVFSSPAITKSGLCIGCVNGTMYHLSHTGTLLWKFVTEAPIFSTATVASASDNMEMIIFGSHDHHLYCVTGQGQLLLKVKVDSPVYSTPFSFSLQGCKVLSSSTAHHSHKEKSGTASVLNTQTIPETSVFEKTKIMESGSMTSECCAISEYVNFDMMYLKGNEHGSTILNIDKNSRLHNYCVFASTRGRIYIVSTTDGRIVSQNSLGGEVFSSPVVCDDCVVVGCRDNFVYCLQLGRK